MAKHRDPEQPDVLNKVWHLAGTTHEVALTELEYAGMRMIEAFYRWMSQAMASMGGGDLDAQEFTILHVIRMQERPKSLSTIARLLNRDDTPNVQYSLRKLASKELIEKARDSSRKTFNYSVTPRGRRLTDVYATVRAQVLVPLTSSIQNADHKLDNAAEFLRIMTGLYDEAGRVAATYSAKSSESAAAAAVEIVRPTPMLRAKRAASSD